MTKMTVAMKADELICQAESLATMLAETDIPTRTEAELRASIAATKFGISRYSALLIAAKDRPIAAGFLNEAREMRDYSINRLRRRVNGAIAKLSSEENEI